MNRYALLCESGAVNCVRATSVRKSNNGIRRWARALIALGLMLSGCTRPTPPPPRITWKSFEITLECARPAVHLSERGMCAGKDALVPSGHDLNL